METITQLNGKFKDPYWFVVLWGSRVIGICAVGLEGDDRGYVYNVGVTKFQQRKRIGSGIAYNLVKKFKGYTLRGTIHKDNYNAMIFFTKLGAKEKSNYESQTFGFSSSYYTYELQV